MKQYTSKPSLLKKSATVKQRKAVTIKSETVLKSEGLVANDRHRNRAQNQVILRKSFRTTEKEKITVLKRQFPLK